MSDALRTGGIAPPPAPDFEADNSLESTAFAGAAAIQRLIAERHSLRSTASAQQRELEAMRAINEDLRRRLHLIRRHYVELGTKVIAHLEQFQHATRDAMRETEGAVAGDEANLIALAQRLRRGGHSGLPDPTS